MLVMQVTRHPADLCPAYHDKFREITVQWYENIESIASKFGVKFLGSWDDHADHSVYVLYDTPSMDNLMGMMMDPVASGPMAFCSGRVFPVFDHQTTLNMIKK
ncbi:MAG: hypothetical protein SA339_01935 [Methanomassiliicoccus sp.]|nr:hypothetical protein [Methanomassiliicoccus sp.]